MNLIKRIFAPVLAAALLAGALAGCSGRETQPTPTPTSVGGDLFSQSSVPQVATADQVARIMGYPRETPLFTVNGRPVSAEDFLYCLSYAIDSVGYSSFDGAESIDWEQGQVEGAPVRTYVMDSAVENAEFYALVQAKAEEYQIGLTQDQSAQLDEEIRSVIEQLGGEEAYAKRLEMVGLSDEGFRRLSQTNLLYENIQSHLFSDGGSKAPTREDLITFAEGEYDLLFVKHILIRTVDDDSQPLPEEERAAAKTLAEDILAQLRAADDPIGLFDTLMKEHSQDGRDASGELYSADGYLFTAGQMVAAFEEGARALEYDQISDLVETEYGYHIILRLAPINDEVRYYWEISAMNSEVDEWLATAQIETTEEFSAIDPKTFYEAMSALRAELEESEPTPTPTPEGDDPTPTPEA